MIPAQPLALARTLVEAELTAKACPAPFFPLSPVLQTLAVEFHNRLTHNPHHDISIATDATAE